MMFSVPLVLSAFAATAFAHGVVTDVRIDGSFYPLYHPYKTPYQNPQPKLAGWTLPNNGPIVDVSSPAIACNEGSKPGAIALTAPAGCDITFFWTEWAESHIGPAMTYMAAAGTETDPTKLNFFKIHDAGLEDGVWASDKLRANNNSISVTIPADLKAGKYVVRHELLALHEGNKKGGAQFYPVCLNVDVISYGSAVPKDTVKFPGAYKPDDAGILFNIYYPKPTSYPIPGPKAYVPSSFPSAPSVSSSSEVPMYTTPASTPSSTPTYEEPTSTKKAAPTTKAAYTPKTSAKPTKKATTSYVTETVKKTVTKTKTKYLRSARKTKTRTKTKTTTVYPQCSASAPSYGRYQRVRRAIIKTVKETVTVTATKTVTRRDRRRRKVHYKVKTVLVTKTAACH